MTLTKEDLQAIGAMFKPVYERFDGLEERFDGLEGRFEGLEDRMDKLEKSVSVIKKSVLYMENVQYKKIEVSMDAIQDLKEKDKQQNERLDALEKSVEVHDLKLLGLCP